MLLRGTVIARDQNTLMLIPHYQVQSSKSMLINVWSENKVQISESDFLLKNLEYTKCLKGQIM